MKRSKRIYFPKYEFKEEEKEQETKYLILLGGILYELKKI